MDEKNNCEKATFIVDIKNRESQLAGYVDVGGYQ